MRVSIILLMSLAASHLHARLLPPKYTALEEDLSDCILDISRTYLRTDLPLLVQTPDTWPEFSEKSKHGDKIIEALQNRGNVPLAVSGQTKSLDLNTRNAMKPGSYLFILIGIRRSIFGMAGRMFERIGADTRNNRAPLMFVTDYLPERFAALLLSIALGHGYTEALVVNHVRDEVYVLGWLPKHQRNLCKLTDVLFLKPHYMDTWNCTEKKFKGNNNLFPSKRLVDIKNCILFGRVDSNLLHIAPLISMPYILFKKSKMFRVFDVSVAAGSHFTLFIPHTDYRTVEECRATYPHIKEELEWYVPPGTTVPRWLAIFKAFGPDLWILAAFTFIMGTVVSYLLAVDRSFTKAAMNALLSHLAVGVEDKLTGTIAATFFAFWLFYCLHINTAYQAALFGFLVDPGEVPPIQTLEELENSELEMYALTNLSVFFGNKYENLTIDISNMSWISRISTKKDMGILEFSSSMNTFHGRLRTPDGKPYILPLLEKVDTVYFSVLIESGLSCMIHDHIDNMLTRCTEAGFFERHIRLLNSIGNMIYKNNTTTDVFSFSLSYLEGAFYVLLYGLLSALFVFLCEVLCNKIAMAFPNFTRSLQLS